MTLYQCDRCKRTFTEQGLWVLHLEPLGVPGQRRTIGEYCTFCIDAIVAVTNAVIMETKPK